MTTESPQLHQPVDPAGSAPTTWRYPNGHPRTREHVAELRFVSRRDASSSPFPPPPYHDEVHRLAHILGRVDIYLFVEYKVGLRRAMDSCPLAMMIDSDSQYNSILGECIRPFWPRAFHSFAQAQAGIIKQQDSIHWHTHQPGMIIPTWECPTVHTTV